MQDFTPIPIPLRQRWNQFRMRLLPVLVFVLAAAGAYFSLTKQGTYGGIVGEVYAPMSLVNASRDGWFEGAGVEVFDQVVAGQELGTIRIMPTDYTVRALEVLREEIRMIELGVGDPVLDQQRNLLSLMALRRDWLLARSDLASLQVRIAQASSDHARAANLVKTGGISQSEFELARSIHETLKAEEEDKVTLVESLGESLRAAELKDPDGANTGIHDGIASAIKWREAELRRVEAELAPVVVAAPLSGRVSKIYRWAGDAVELGETLLEIRSEEPRMIIGYLKPPLAVDPQVGMDVVIVPRRAQPGPGEVAKVLAIGAHHEPVPLALMRQMPYMTEERALPIQISLPENTRLKPGELVDIRLPQ